MNNIITFLNATGKNIIKLLIFLSKTDNDIFDKCTDFTKKTRVALGMSILLTALLAYASMNYALTVVFTENYFIIPILSVIWSLIIINIDREIVSSGTKRIMVFRLPIAVIIGFIIAIPIELKILKPYIDKQLHNYYIEENIHLEGPIYDLESRFEKDKSIVIMKIAILEKNVLDYNTDIIAQVKGVTKNGNKIHKGKGTIYYTNIRLKKQDESKIRAYKKELIKLESDYQKKKQILLEIKEEKESKLTNGLLSQLSIVNNDKSSTTLLISWCLRLVFVILELMPVLIRLFQDTDEYDELLNARRLFNNSIIASEINDGLLAIKNKTIRNINYVEKAKFCIKK